MLETPTLWQLIEARAAKTPEARLAVDAEGRTLDFIGYREACLRTARGLVQLGVGPGRTVSWALPTRMESLILVGALARLDAIQNPILPIYRHREVRFIAQQCRPCLLITPPEWRGFDYPAMAAEIASEQDDMKALVVDRALPEAGEEVELPPPPEALEPASLPVRWLFYTSGTTADPKGVQHTDASLWAAAKGMSLGLAIEPEDRVAFVFPITHIGGINWLQAALSFGCSHILIENFAAETTMPTLRREGMTLGAAGTVFHEAYLAAHRASEEKPLFPTLRAFTGGGAPKPPQLHYELIEEMGGVGIVAGYGMTEAPILTMASVGDPTDKLAETEGRVSLPEVDLRVVRDDGQLAAPGEQGELRCKGPQLFRGYLDPELNATAFDEDGYFRSGDLGILDADGYCVVTGRLKDVIIRKGENIPAKEVEDLLYRHPKVADVAVIGLPDPRSGERCCAVVECHDPDEPLGFEEMQRFLREQQLMLQKIPEQLELIDLIPRNPTGKILKHELRERYAKA
jgi:cyclohexanecarboxylate-CoA ligase